MRRLVLVLVVSMGAVTACGGGGGAAPKPTAAPAVSVSASAAAAKLPARPTSLPLQAHAPAVGGGSRSGVHQLFSIGLTEQEAGRVAAACAQSTAIAPGSGCLGYLASLGSPCSPAKPICASVGAYTGSDGTQKYVLTITDSRPGSPLCNRGPGGLCFVLPVDAGSIGRLASAASALAGSATPTPSVSAPTGTPSVPATTPTPAISPGAPTPSPAPTA